MTIRAATTDTGYGSDYTASGKVGAIATGYIPELFAKKMLINFFEKTLWMDLCNTDYQGEIKGMGDKVTMATTPDIAITDYEVGEVLTYASPTGTAPRTLLIDQGLKWTYKIEDIDSVQTHLNLLNAFSMQAADKMAQAVDTNMLQFITVGNGTATAGSLIDASNRGVAAGAITASVDLGAEYTTVSGDNAIAFTNTGGGAETDVVSQIVNANLVLDEANISSDNRWIVLPAWACALLKKGDLKDASITGDATGVIRNGLIGMIDGMKVYRSNNIYHATESGGTGDDVELFYIPFGTTEGVTFASQLVKTESLRLQTDFGDAFRGLNVFGRAMAQPTAVGMIIAKR